jgi:AraC-like DNA-binding protein
MLFEPEGVSFTTYVINQRLARAHRMLCDPLFDHRSISAIALAVGFGDISYFNRTFRRCFGATPSDVRRQSRQ